MGKMNDRLLELLGAETGAASVITPTEATHDKSITVDNDEKKVMEISYPEMNFPRRGGDGENVREEFHFYVHPYNDLRNSTLETAYIVYPKQNKSELRLYFNESSKFTISTREFRKRSMEGMFPHWYIYQKDDENFPHIGMADAQYIRSRDGFVQVRENKDDAAYQSGLQNVLAGKKAGVRTFKYQRSFKQAVEALEAAGFVCEADPSHETFVSAASGNSYVEGHHLIPLSFQEQFEYSIDVKENIIALCPNCHRLLHHGTNEDKREILLHFLSERQDSLFQKDITIDEETLLSYYLFDEL